MRMLLALTLVLAMARSLEGSPSLHAREQLVAAAASSVDPSPLDDRQGRLGIAYSHHLVWQRRPHHSKQAVWSGFGGSQWALQRSGWGCASVLDRPWASVSGVPLALFGMIAYARCHSAAMPLVSRLRRWQRVARPTQPPRRRVLRRLCSFGCSRGLFSCLVLLLLVIKESCALCIGSAASRSPSSSSRCRRPCSAADRDSSLGSGGLISAAAAAPLALAMLRRRRRPPPLGEPPTVVARSSPRSLSGAAAEARGGRFFGAYWCSHCNRSRHSGSGIEAVPYVECDRGVRTRGAPVLRCRRQGVPDVAARWEALPGRAGPRRVGGHAQGQGTAAGGWCVRGRPIVGVKPRA